MRMFLFLAGLSFSLQLFFQTPIVHGDLTGDSKVGLDDAVYALQVVAGQREAEEWVLYDDFESGTIDPTKWETGCNREGATADFEIVNGRLKIAYQSTSGVNAYCYAASLVSQFDREIIAVKVDIIVESSTEDSRGRVRFDRLYDDKDYYDSINLYGFRGLIECYSEILSTITWESLLDSNLQFKHPVSVIGETYTVVLKVLPNKSVYEVENVGLISTSSGDNIQSEETFPFVIDVKSSSGDGVATVYFDNVYILYE